MLVTLESGSEDFAVDEKALSYTGAEYQKIIKLGDRHVDTDQRREDRHLDKSDHHLDKSDRHQFDRSSLTDFQLKHSKLLC